MAGDENDAEDRHKPAETVIAMSGVAAVHIAPACVRAFTSAGLPWLVEGYERALTRFTEASQHDERDAREVFFSLFEALAWFDAVDEYLKPRKDPIGERHVRGMRYARRRVHHQWADAVIAKEYASAQSAGSSGTTFDWFWKPVDNLPAPERGYRDPTGEKTYDTLLADRPARDALESVRRYLARRRDAQ